MKKNRKKKLKVTRVISYHVISIHIKKKTILSIKLKNEIKYYFIEV